MNLKIETLTVADLPVVDELMKRNSGTLGFLTAEALRRFLDDGQVLWCQGRWWNAGRLPSIRELYGLHPGSTPVR